ncbi:MAG: HNH endonuclease [Deltaproteobacteria bacterium]|nr:HNH endonuclease [Deltaproteobacteria bacterium]
MRVFVKNKRNQSLMPCKPQRARLLLKHGKAKIISYLPFTIQLFCATGETIQPIKVGIDSGAKYIGFAITSGNKVFGKGTIELRDDVSNLLTVRKTYRRSRRNRKTRYRKPRFENRSKPEGWLPPSIQSRVDNTINWINKIMKALPEPEITVEVGKFDAAKLKNPDIQGKAYQQGEAFGFWNTRYYVFARDNYTCQICKKKGDILQTHHIIQKRDGGTDNADNLVSIHAKCHADFHQGRIHHTFKKPKQYRETVFMNVLRRQILKRVNCKITYGSYTKIAGDTLALDKSHHNDAIAIAGIKAIKSNPNDVLYIKQFRKKKRSLHEAIPRKGRKIPNRAAKRNAKNTKELKGVFLGDSVSVFGQKGYVSGFTGTSGFYVKTIGGEYITKLGKAYKQVSYKDITFIRHNGFGHNFGHFA